MCRENKEVEYTNSMSGKVNATAGKLCGLWAKLKKSFIGGSEHAHLNAVNFRASIKPGENDKQRRIKHVANSRVLIV